MFTEPQKLILIAAIDMLIKSHKRAKNAAKSPAFNEIYDTEIAAAETLLTQIRQLKPQK